MIVRLLFLQSHKMINSAQPRSHQTGLRPRESGVIFLNWLRAKNVRASRRPAGEALVSCQKMLKAREWENQK